MRRREFVTLVGCAAATWPMAGRAESTNKVRRVAVLMGIANDDEGLGRVAALQKTLGELGWLEGRNIIFDTRWAAGDINRARSYASELISLKPDLIVANSAIVLSAVREVTSTIPTVFVQVNDPVRQGFVNSMSRPDGNITGFLNFEEAIAGKWIELLKDIAPSTTRIAMLFSPETASRGSGGNVYQELIKASTSKLKIDVVAVPVRSRGEIADAIANFVREPNGAIVVLPDTFNTVNRTTIVAAVAQHRVPSIYPYRYFVAAGGMISYGVEPIDLYRRTASYVDSILRGAKIIDLPVQAPTKFELVINLRTAKTLGLTVPQSLLARADEVIE